jgi:ADP-heptose:LPS heptosyltransferase
LDIFQERTFDHLVIGPALGLCPNPTAMVRDLTDKLRMGGHVVFYLKKNYRTPQTQVVFDGPSMQPFLEQVGAWKIKAEYIRGDDMLLIAKKVAGTKGTIIPPRARATKRACICRYGALGDMIMITPLIRQLAEDGYEVTMNITGYAAPLLENNPYVGNIIIQEREAIPNHDLGRYWKEWEGEYDRYINLSESIEGKLLKVENRRDYFTSQAWREATCNKNYYDQTMELGGYPGVRGRRGELYFTPAERKDIERLKGEHPGKILVGWGLNGSSYHKIYPLTEPVCHEWLAKHPEVIVFLLGGPEATKYEFDHPQVVRTAGKWPLRRTLAFIAMGADLMIGPESMVMNTAACYDVPKITFLSHSSHENLCKYWTNDYCLTPDTDNAPCYPCHQLHYSLESCPQVELRDSATQQVVGAGPACAMAGVHGDRMLARLEEVYAKHLSPVGV